MDDRRAALAAAAARLDAFLVQAVEEFGHNACDAAETNRRIDAHIKANARPAAAEAKTSRPAPAHLFERHAA